MKVKATDLRLSSLLTALVICFGFTPLVADEKSKEDGDKPAIKVEPEEEITVIDKRYRSPSIPRTFGSSRIRDWHAPDNKTLIIDAGPGRKFKATFMSSCLGIRFTDTIAFSTMGPFELDRSTKVILPDGQVCFFKDLELIPD